METSGRKHKEYCAGHRGRQELSEQSATVTGTSPGGKDGHDMKISLCTAKETTGDRARADLALGRRARPAGLPYRALVSRNKTQTQNQTQRQGTDI